MIYFIYCAALYEVHDFAFFVILFIVSCRMQNLSFGVPDPRCVSYTAPYVRD
jgi:hypothetical protein